MTEKQPKKGRRGREDGKMENVFMKPVQVRREGITLLLTGRDWGVTKLGSREVLDRIMHNSIYTKGNFKGYQKKNKPSAGEYQAYGSLRLRLVRIHQKKPTRISPDLSPVATERGSCYRKIKVGRCGSDMGAFSFDVDVVDFTWWERPQ